MEDKENTQNSDSLNEQYVPKVQGEMIFENAMPTKPIPQALQNQQTTMVSSNQNQGTASGTASGSDSGAGTGTSNNQKAKTTDNSGK